MSFLNPVRDPASFITLSVEKQRQSRLRTIYLPDKSNHNRTPSLSLLSSYFQSNKEHQQLLDRRHSCRKNSYSLNYKDSIFTAAAVPQ